MSNSIIALGTRTTSSFNLSIGTGIAFEALFNPRQDRYDPDREPPLRVSVRKYSEVWINLLLLFRNITSSIPSQYIQDLHAQDVADVLAEEVDEINRIFKEEASDVKVVFYACNYKGIENKYPAAKLRYPDVSKMTAKQAFMHSLLSTTLVAFFKKRAKSENIRLFEHEIAEVGQRNGLIMTNFAIDLLSLRIFKKLDLLESHTGALKPPSLWYTKLSASHTELVRIPFHAVFLQIFGDAQTFAPLPLLFRAAVVKLASDNKWTQLTHYTKAFEDLRKLPQEHAALAKKLIGRA